MTACSQATCVPGQDGLCVPRERLLELGAGIILLRLLKWQMLQKTGGKNLWMEETIIVADLIKTEMRSCLTS